jgi:hypothetical protein
MNGVPTVIGINCATAAQSGLKSLPSFKIPVGKPEKNISKAFACTLFPLTFAAPISSFEYPPMAEIRNPADAGLGD